MKRLPLIAGFVLFIALCVSAAYWAMQLFKPAVRPVAAPPPSKTEARPEAAAGLFGGRASGTAVASNFELRGVVVSGSARESIAILAADGKPPQAVRVNTEIMPGVKVTEVHPGYVMLIEGGVTKRVELPESVPAQGGEGLSSVPRTPIPVPAAQPPATPAGAAQNPQVMNGRTGVAQPPQTVTPQAAQRPQPAGQPSTVQSGNNQNNQLRPGTTSVFDPNANPNLAPAQQATPDTAQPAEPPTQEQAAPQGMPGGGHPGLVER